jgi:hypothetical protein
VNEKDENLMLPTNRLECVRESLRKAFPLQVGDFEVDVKMIEAKRRDPGR